MPEALDTIRVNIRIHSKLHEYYKLKSESTGIPMSYLMSMDLLEKANQDQFITQFPEMMELAKKMDKPKE